MRETKFNSAAQNYQRYDGDGDAAGFVKTVSSFIPNRAEANSRSTENESATIQLIDRLSHLSNKSAKQSLLPASKT